MLTAKLESAELPIGYEPLKLSKINQIQFFKTQDMRAEHILPSIEDSIGDAMYTV